VTALQSSLSGVIVIDIDVRFQGPPEPFTVAIPEADLDDLRARLQRSRWADDFTDDWRYGVPGRYLRELVEYWIEAYDWRATETRINGHPQFRVVIDGTPIHFLRVRGRGPAPLPLILTHGWPWSFWDYEAAIGPLSDPASHGADPEDAFDVVVPSLPGYAFSSPLRTKVDFVRIAQLWVDLMTGVLGYERFAAHGADWGSWVTAQLGHAHADRLIGIHLSMACVLHLTWPSQVAAAEYGDDEHGWRERSIARSRLVRSHVTANMDQPQNLGWALNDSPAGLAAWIVQQRRTASDCDGEVERAFTKDQLLTNVAIYWFTQTAHSAARLYAETVDHPWRPVHDREPRIEAPTGVAVSPQDVILLPRRLVERHANLQRWTVMPRGGHFGPAEEPALFVEDVRAFFRPLRRSTGRASGRA
jgi:pimeloyl-ACP methyl ester carboxylesterase